MKNTLIKVIKVFFIVLAVILAGLLIYGLVLWRDWPWWVGLIIVLFLVGAWVGYLFFRKIYLRRREQLFVQEVIAQDEAHMQSLSAKEKDEMKELQERWKEAIDALKKSHLKKLGNPLYVLPWYLVMGESGSGKTTSLNSARLSSPFAEVSKTSGISGTKNCDWWFFEQAIIIDTAGRYAIPVDEGKDKDEWQKFLGQLIKYRKKEPIHGLIVTVSAEKLLSAAPEVLEADGKNIRRRIDELMRVLGVRFPIYLLVTKCDLVQGMTQFSDHLPEKTLEQPMGMINRELIKDAAGFLERSMTSVGERLRTLRLLLLHKTDAKSVDPGLLLFPEEFENLKKGLQFFMKGAFTENPYQESAILRGVYFSSGRQEGSPYSHFLNALGLIGERDVLPGTSKGLFLHDFFSRILPNDRKLFAPTKRALEWKTLTRNLGLASWIIIGLAICGLMSFSFVKNLRAIREVSHEFTKPPTLRGDMLEDLITMDRLRQSIVNLEARNTGWWIPRFGLYESRNVEVALKNKYCKQFHDVFLVSFDKQMSDAMGTLNAGSSDDIVGQYIVHLVRRINLIKARLADEKFAGLQVRPQPLYVSSVTATGDQGIGPEVRKKFGFLYLYYLVWRSDSADLNKEVELLQTWLKHLLSLKGSNLNWLVIWVDNHSGLPPVTLADFWGGSTNLPDEKRIGPSFTRKGNELIFSFIKEFEAALPDPVMIANQKAGFDKWYKGAYLGAWQDFSNGFPRGSERLKGEKEWMQMAAKMTTDDSPYMSLLRMETVEFEPFATTMDLPLWLQQVYQFQMIKLQSGVAGGVIGKAADEGKRLLSRFESAVKDTTGKQIVTPNIEAASKAYQEYQTAITGLAPVSASRSQAYQLALQVYSEEAAGSKSPFYAAQNAAVKLKAATAGGKVPDETFSRLLTGPVDFMWAFARKQTGCYLQSQWDEKVLAESQGASGTQAAQLLLGPQGLATKFATGTAGPFLGRGSKQGFFPKEAMGGSVSFESSFLSFMAKGAAIARSGGATKQSYNVVIHGEPTDANPEARVKPQSTNLEMQCANGAQTLANYNYPASKTFVWAPESCNDVTLQINFGGGVTLTRRYSGPQAFSDFLQEFQGGRRTFNARDYPAEKGALDRMGVSYVRVNYRFSGDQAILGQMRGLPGQVPRSIAQCWGQ